MSDKSNSLLNKPEGEPTSISIVKYTFQQDGVQGSTTPSRNPTWFDVWPQILSSAISLSTVIQSGISLAYSGVLIPQLANDPNFKEFTKDQASWIASLVVISQPIGALCVGPLMDFIGRKKTCLFSNIPIVFSWIIIFFTKSSVWPIYLARVLAGLSSGMTTVGLVYTAEVSHAQFRPMLMSLNSVNVALGILIATVLGVYIEWHFAALVFCSFAIISFLLSLYLPESPYWLANFTSVPTKQIKHELEFLNRPKWLFDEEWDRIQKDVDEKKKKSSQDLNTTSIITKLTVFFERPCYMPLLLLMMLFLLQQTSGTYVVIFYTVNMFKSIGGDFGFGFNEYSATTALGILRFIMSFVSAGLSKKVGRRPLLIVSSLGMAISCIATAVFLSLNGINVINFESDNLNITDLTASKSQDKSPLKAPINSWWIMLSLLSFVCTGALGQMVIPWTLMGELLPTKIRASGSGLLVSYSGLILFVVIKTFPYFIDYLTLPYVFVSYSIMSFLAIIFVYFYLPETLGKHFTEIAKNFEKK